MGLPIGFSKGSTAYITFTDGGIEIEIEGAWTQVMCDAAHRQLMEISHKEQLKTLAKKSSEIRAAEMEVDEMFETHGIEVITAEEK